MSFVKVFQAQGRIPVTVFDLQYQINLGNTADLVQAGKKAFEEGTRDLVINISKVEAFTSAGIRALMIIYKMMAGEEGKHSKHVKVVSPNSHVREVLDVSGITESIEIYDTQDEAIASF